MAAIGRELRRVILQPEMLYRQYSMNAPKGKKRQIGLLERSRARWPDREVPDIGDRPRLKIFAP